jgi:hypothetical protein
MLSAQPSAECRVCGRSFLRFNTMQAVCGAQCAQRVGPLQRKASAKAKSDECKKTRDALEALKTVPQLKKAAQVAFNAFIRARDANQPCISCGAPPPDLSGLHAGRDAGHYRSTGSADHLRFNEANCHAQCVKCNQWGAGRAVDYRIGLVRRIGLSAVEGLETNNDPVKWQRDELRAIRDMYRRRTRELNKRMENQ